MTAPGLKLARVRALTYMRMYAQYVVGDPLKILSVEYALCTVQNSTTQDVVASAPAGDAQ
jgi:hypothetical protein